MMGVGGKQRRVAVAVAAMAATLALVATTCLAMSIETEPVKVTHRNSGPRYEMAAENEVERTRMAPEESSSSPEQPMPPPPSPATQEGGEQEASGEPRPIGHVAIRRIYLFPMMTRGPSEWSSERGGEQQPPARGDRPPQSEQEIGPSMFARPLWPFLTPARPSHHEHQPAVVHRPHLFGADEASRSPGAAEQDQAASGEREEPTAHRQQQHHHHQVDPIQMMLDMMHQAIAAQMVPPSDLSKEPVKGTSSGNDNDNSPAESSGSDERPTVPDFEFARQPKPAGQNETSEDIVEIEGRKYLRKTVVQRHIGQNLIFMTKRLIFVPLNETTDPMAPTTETVATTTPTDASTTAATTEPITSPTTEEFADRVGENKPTTTTPSATEAPAPASAAGPEETVSITAKSEPPTTMAPSASTEQAATTPVASTEMAAESTTPKSTEAPVERASDDLEKTTERAIEEAKPDSESSSSTTTTTSTEMPVTSTDKPQ